MRGCLIVTETSSRYPCNSIVYSVVSLPAKQADRAALNVVCIVDPLSTHAQRLGPLINVIQQITNADIKLVMNPKAKLSELPLKR